MNEKQQKTTRHYAHILRRKAIFDNSNEDEYAAFLQEYWESMRKADEERRKKEILENSFFDALMSMANECPESVKFEIGKAYDTMEYNTRRSEDF